MIETTRKTVQKCLFCTPFLDEYTQTPSSLSWDSPRKHKMRMEIKRLTSLAVRPKSDDEENLSKDRITAYVRKHFDQGLANIIELHLNFQEKCPQAYRYTAEYKQFALTIYFLGPNVYKYLQKMLHLPSMSTLYRITKNWDISSGINDCVFCILKSKSQMMCERERNCVLCMDEMSIKKFLSYNRRKDEIIGFHKTSFEKKNPAKSVFVIMARGLLSNWKQPLAYYFVETITAEEILKIINEVVVKLVAINMMVHAVVSDQGVNFIRFVKINSITSDHPYFYVEDTKLFYFFDAPHLLKSTRNNFLKYNFSTSEGVTDSKYVTDFYKRDKHLSLRLAPKLTDDHIYPSAFKKMKVKLAAQLFSNTVASALNTYKALDALPSTSSATIQFIQKIDRLFDLLNSSRVSGSKDFNRPFKGTEVQITFLNQMLDEFNCMKILHNYTEDVTKKVKFLNGWKISINSLIGIHIGLKEKYPALYTRRINQDCLENFFGSLRQQAGNCRNPTAVQVNQGFKKLFCLNYFQQSDGTNCAEDFDTVLSSVNAESIRGFQVVVSQKVNFSNLNIQETDYSNLNLVHKNAVSYLCGYLLKKCFNKHRCDLCELYSKNNNLAPHLLYIHFKAYENTHKDNFGNLQAPPETFLEYLFVLEKQFSFLFEKYAIEVNCGLKIKNQLEKLKSPHPCSQFPQNFFLSLYVRLKIYHVLKNTNRAFKENKYGRNQKLKNLKNI